MDDQINNVEESSGMSISSDQHGIEQRKESNMQGEAPTDSVLEDPELGMAFDSVDDLREYYSKLKNKRSNAKRKASENDILQQE
jgi:hypothetical protein